MLESATYLKDAYLITKIIEKVRGLFSKEELALPLASEYVTRGFHILLHKKNSKKDLALARRLFDKSLGCKGLFPLCAYGMTSVFMALKDKTSATKYVNAIPVEEKPEMEHLVEELRKKIYTMQ